MPNGLAVQCLTSQKWMFSVSSYSQPELTQLTSDEKELSEFAACDQSSSASVDNSARFPFDSASRLFRFFFGRSDECLKGKAHILLATDPDFFALPWNAFVTEPPAGQDVSFRDAAWLPRKYAISLLPSVKSIYQIRTGPPSKSGETRFSWSWRPRPWPARAVGCPDTRAAIFVPRRCECRRDKGASTTARLRRRTTI